MHRFDTMVMGLGKPSAGIVGRGASPLCWGVPGVLGLWPLCAGVAFAQEPAAVAGPGEVAVEVGPGPVARPVVGPAAVDVAVGTGTRGPAVEVVTARKVRHDWYVGFAFGLGGGNLRAQGGGLRAGVSVTTLLRGGARVTDRIAVGALGVTSFGADKAAQAGFSSLLVEGLFFPIKGRGLGVAVALGVSSAWLRVAGTGELIDSKATRFGGGFGLGVGYDFWLARRFNLGLWLRGDGSAGGFGLRASGSIGLAFSWF